MKKRNKKFKIEKKYKRIVTWPRHKTNFKRRFWGFWEEARPRGRRWKVPIFSVFIHYKFEYLWV